MHGAISLALFSRVRRTPGYPGQLLHLTADTFTAGPRAGHFDRPAPAGARAATGLASTRQASQRSSNG